MTLHPVKIPNAQQNTPNGAALDAQIARDDSAQKADPTPLSLAVADLIAQFQQEKTRL